MTHRGWGIRNRSIHLAVVVGALLSTPVHGVCQDRAAEAQTEFDNGVSLFNAGLYENAARAFRKANDIKPSWSLLFNIAQSEAAAKRYDLAYEAFEEYLVKGGDAIDNKRRELVTTELDKMQKLIGSLEVSAPDGATITIDGFERGTAPLPGRLKISVSRIHTVEVRLEGVWLLSEEVKVSQGENVRLEAAKRPLSAKENEPGPESAEAQTTDMRTDESEEDSTATGVRVIGWMGMGLGIPSLVAAAATGGVALSINKDLRPICKDGVCPTESSKNRRDTRDALAASCDGLLIAGIAVTGMGIGFLVWSHKIRKENETQPTISVVPIIGGTTAGIDISGRF